MLQDFDLEMLMSRNHNRRPLAFTLLLVVPLLLSGCAERSTPVEPPSNSPRALIVPAYAYGQLALGDNHSCTIRSDQNLTCWGHNVYGQLGGSPSNPGTVTTTGPFRDLSAFGQHTCAVRAGGVLECWGRNDAGEVGAPPTTTPPYWATATYPGPFTRVAAGSQHTCAVRTDGSVSCWGNSSYNATTVPPSVANVSQLVAGSQLTCALHASSFTCWGRNSYGQINDAPSPAPTTGTRTGPFAQITAGISHVCALRSDDGNVVCWGNNQFGQVGGPVTPTFPHYATVTHAGPFVHVGAGAQHTCAVRADGTVSCWGWNGQGQTNVPAGLTATVEVRGGLAHTCARKTDNTLTCWGYNGTGQVNVPSVPTTHIGPEAAFSFPSLVPLGQSFTLQLADAAVPGHPEATTFTYAFDCGSGYGAFGSSATTTCTPTVVGALTVRGKVKDQDGDVREYTGTVDVNDPTPPAITPTVIGTLGANGWYTSDVTVTWSTVDTESSITSPACASTTIGADTQGQDVTCSATSGGGTDSKTVTIKRDATAPTLAPTVSPSAVPLNGSATVTPNASDATSGLTTASCGATDAATPGVQSVACTATDSAGNTNTANASYSVVYSFTGFFEPVDNLPTLNVVKAGSAIPLKFGLGGNQGLGILASGYPASQQASCSGGASEDAIEQTVTAGGSSLSYDASVQRYTYVWKTDKSWSGTCRTLTAKLIDGTTHQATFKFN
jgi:alpha-tubulin suppressor-like RCC1 family protein